MLFAAIAMATSLAQSSPAATTLTDPYAVVDRARPPQGAATRIQRTLATSGIAP